MIRQYDKDLIALYNTSHEMIEISELNMNKKLIVE